MLSQRLTADQNLNKGQIVITAAEGNLAELMGLHEELRLRINMTTEGSIITLPEPEPPPMGLAEGLDIER